MTTATAVKPPRTTFSVDYMSEGDWLVRGTLDPMEALRLIVDVMDEKSETDAMLHGVSPNLPGRAHIYGEHDPTAVDGMASYLFDLLERARPGLYRKVHCLPTSYGAWEGWAWQIGFPKERGPGVFEGVYFQPW